MQIFDDFLPYDIHTEVSNTLMKDSFPWYYHYSTINDIAYIPPSNVIDTHQLYHNVYNKIYNTCSDYLPTFRKALFFLEEKTNLEVCEIWRIKANFTTPYPNWQSNNYHPPHHDMPNDNSMSLLYYPDDSDGPTYFFDKSFSQGYDNLKIINTVEPKANRAVLFPSGQYHASSCPINYPKRIVVNYIFDVS